MPVGPHQTPGNKNAQGGRPSRVNDTGWPTQAAASHKKALQFYSVPSDVTFSLVSNGKLVDHDTAEVTALPLTLNPKTKALGVSSSAASSDSEMMSRPASATAMRGVQIDQSTPEAIANRSLYAHPSLYDGDDASGGVKTGSRVRRRSRSADLSIEKLFAHRADGPPYGEFTLYRRACFAITQLISNVLSSTFLIFVVIWALSVRFLATLPSLFSQGAANVRPWDEPKRWAKEDLVKDVRYYAKQCGYEIHNEKVETQDGYYLRMHRVVCPERANERRSNGKGECAGRQNSPAGPDTKIRSLLPPPFSFSSFSSGGFPVLIMHGLFQSSGSFVTSEERSLAFWLAKHGGYQVYLGNNRGVFDMGHRVYSRSSPRFWDYNIRELACYDLPAMVDYIRKETGYDKIGYIGHSQGNATAFIALSQGMVPELGDKLTYFGALAPAVFAGPLTSCFPFTTLSTMDWSRWKRFFGVLDFIPLMKSECWP